MKTRLIGLLVLSATAVLGLAPAAQAEVRVSPNYRLAADKAPFRFQDQPGLAVNPNNPNHVVAVNANYLDSDCETSVSTDGGSTWSPPVSLRPPTGQNFRQWCHNTVGTNQIVEFGTGQNVYTAVSAQRDVPGIGFLEDAAALLYKSTDGGADLAGGRRGHGRWPGRPRSQHHGRSRLVPALDRRRPRSGYRRCRPHPHRGPRHPLDHQWWLPHAARKRLQPDQGFGLRERWNDLLRVRSGSDLWGYTPTTSRRSRSSTRITP